MASRRRAAPTPPPGPPSQLDRPEISACATRPRASPWCSAWPMPASRSPHAAGPGFLHAGAASTTAAPLGPQWQSYINRPEEVGTPAEGVSAVARHRAALQATTENSGTLTNRGDGIYIYRFATNLRNVTAPLAVRLRRQRGAPRRHRVPRRRGSLPTQPRLHLGPAGGELSVPRKIVDNAQCNECHASWRRTAARAPRRDYCVTCHNPGSGDAQSGNSVDFKTDDPQDPCGRDAAERQAGHPYVIWGFQQQPRTTSRRSSSRSRSPTAASATAATAPRRPPATPGSSTRRSRPAARATTTSPSPSPSRAGSTRTRGGPACPSPQRARAATPRPSSRRATRASTTRPNNPGRPADVPVVSYELLGLDAVAGAQPVVTFRVLVNGAPADLRQACRPSFEPGHAPRAPSGPRLHVAWRSPEGSVGDAVGLQQRRQRRYSSAASRGAVRQHSSPTLSANADGSYTTGAGRPRHVPAGVIHVSVGIEGLLLLRARRGAAEELGPDSVVAGARRRPPRREIVDLAKCDACHDRLTAHGDNRVNNIEICVLCHNPNATDNGRRPANAEPDAIDGLPEQAIDFRQMIHKIHRGEELTEAQLRHLRLRRTGPNDFKEVRFPGTVENCLICHNEDTFRCPSTPTRSPRPSSPAPIVATRSTTPTSRRPAPRAPAATTAARPWRTPRPRPRGYSTTAARHRARRLRRSATAGRAAT